MMIEFLDQFYDVAIRLSNDFAQTREKEWGPLVILNELGVQIGQIYNIIYHNENVSEKNRKFVNLGDELSDVLLQLIALADCMKIDLYEVKDYQNVDEFNWMALPIVFGQLNESVMEKYGYRFSKPRFGYETIDAFIQSRIILLFHITLNIAVFHGLDMNREFQEMILDATGFLKRFANQKTVVA